MKQLAVSYELFNKLQELPQSPYLQVGGTKVIPTHQLPVTLDDGSIVHAFAVDSITTIDYDTLALTIQRPHKQ